MKFLCKYHGIYSLSLLIHQILPINLNLRNFMYLSVDIDPSNVDKLIRVVSNKESYQNDVEKLMRFCGISIFSFDDIDFVRTSHIVKAAGGQEQLLELLKQKHPGDPDKARASMRNSN